VETLRTEVITALATKADNADVETLRTEVKTALDTKADNADVETLRGEVETRLDNLEVKTDAIITALKSAGVIASA
jgi:porphobilinogen deaminase